MHQTWFGVVTSPKGEVEGVTRCFRLRVWTSPARRKIVLMVLAAGH